MGSHAHLTQGGEKLNSALKLILKASNILELILQLPDSHRPFNRVIGKSLYGILHLLIQRLQIRLCTSQMSGSADLLQTLSDI